MLKKFTIMKKIIRKTRTKIVKKIPSFKYAGDFLRAVPELEEFEQQVELVP